MIEHEHVAIDFQPFVLLTVAQRIGQNLSALVTVEQVIPALYRQGEEIRAGVLVGGNAALGHGCSYHAVMRIGHRCRDFKRRSRFATCIGTFLGTIVCR